MSELLFYLSPTPASVPITAHGKYLYRGDTRFLVKSIWYNPHPPTSDLDPLCSSRFSELYRDILIIRSLGLNTISVRNLCPAVDHAPALDLPKRNGIYVIVAMSMRTRSDLTGDWPTPTEFQQYSIPYLLPNLQLLHSLARHMNILTFCIDASSLSRPKSTLHAPFYRACIRDAKALLKHFGHRAVPISVHVPSIITLLPSTQLYFTAGSISECADIFMHDCFSWVGPSSFRISGWQNMVEHFEAAAVPVPMLLAEYGAQVGRKRVWDEVECLYSPEMTGMYSGGSVYTFFESGNGYGILDSKSDEAAPRLMTEVELERKEKESKAKREDFHNLEARIRKVNVRDEDDLYDERKDEATTYEDWRGGFPQIHERQWLATSEIPEFPGGWAEITRELG